MAWYKTVEISYREYREKYFMCDFKAGSYNEETKTVVVYVPITNDEKKEKGNDNNGIFK